MKGLEVTEELVSTEEEDAREVVSGSVVVSGTIVMVLVSDTVSGSGMVSVEEEPGSGIDSFGRYCMYLAERISLYNSSSIFYNNVRNVSK